MLEEYPCAARSQGGIISRASQHDDGAGREDLRAAALTTADAIDDALQVLKVADTDAGKCVWITGEGEGFDDLWQVRDGGVHVCDLCAGREPQFDESLDLIARHLVIERDCIAADQADLLKPVYPAPGGRRRKTNQSPHLAG